jgi:NAD(P)-dependent dehydrogenase (short-subunit alcohol dehydrogenase family)
VLLARRAESYEGIVTEINSSGGKAIGITADVADPTSLSQAFKTIKEQLPGSKLAAAIYNVNGGFSRKPFLELTYDELNAALDGTV